MNYSNQPDPITACSLMIALTDEFPDSTYGAIPVIDHYEALEAYLAYDDGALAEVPNGIRAATSTDTTTNPLLGDEKHEHTNR